MLAAWFSSIHRQCSPYGVLIDDDDIDNNVMNILAPQERCTSLLIRKCASIRPNSIRSSYPSLSSLRSGPGMGGLKCEPVFDLISANIKKASYFTVGVVCYRPCGIWLHPLSRIWNVLFVRLQKNPILGTYLPPPCWPHLPIDNYYGVSIGHVTCLDNEQLQVYCDCSDNVQAS